MGQAFLVELVVVASLDDKDGKSYCVKYIVIKVCLRAYFESLDESKSVISYIASYTFLWLRVSSLCFIKNVY